MDGDGFEAVVEHLMERRPKHMLYGLAAVGPERIITAPMVALDPDHDDTRALFAHRPAELAIHTVTRIGLDSGRSLMLVSVGDACHRMAVTLSFDLSKAGDRSWVEQMTTSDRVMVGDSCGFADGARIGDGVRVPRPSDLIPLRISRLAAVMMQTILSAAHPPSPPAFTHTFSAN